MESYLNNVFDEDLIIDKNWDGSYIFSIKMPVIMDLSDSSLQEEIDILRKSAFDNNINILTYQIVKK